MPNFLNLKSKPIHLFLWVASTLSMVCPPLVEIGLTVWPKTVGAKAPPLATALTTSLVRNLLHNFIKKVCIFIDFFVCLSKNSYKIMKFTTYELLS